MPTSRLMVAVGGFTARGEDVVWAFGSRGYWGPLVSEQMRLRFRWLRGPVTKRTQPTHTYSVDPVNLPLETRLCSSLRTSLGFGLFWVGAKSSEDLCAWSGLSVCATTCSSCSCRGLRQGGNPLPSLGYSAICHLLLAFSNVETVISIRLTEFCWIVQV